jgi:VWFA-related protein
VIEASTVSAESPTTANGEAWTIYKRVDEVTVFFTVRKGHKYVDDLTAADVRVQDDHQPVEQLSSFGRQTDLPLRLGLLVDTSDSVEYRFRFEKDVSSQFLRTVVRPGIDRAFVMGFSVYQTLTSDYTDDHRQLTAGLSALHSGGDTALFDAVVQVCEKLAGGEGESPVARVLVVLSDGVDNSSKTTLDEAIECAQKRDITIYSVSTNDSWLVQPGDAIMNRLGVETGGRMFRPKANSEMVNAFSYIEREMRSRYAISYHPRDLTEDGRYHGIEIIAQRSHKRFHVDARKGYYAPRPGSPPSR